MIDTKQMIFSTLTALCLWAAPAYAAEPETAVFAGGCFWCMEPPFEKMPGVLSVESGYTGGTVANPTYEQVSSGTTGHREVVRVTYDPDIVNYETLLLTFWPNVDPLDDGGQFCDRGFQYSSAIYVDGEPERIAAAATRKAVAERFNTPVATEIIDSAPFYLAEDYHQDYYKDHSWRYKFYRSRCGRDNRLRERWGDEAGGPAVIGK